MVTFIVYAINAQVEGKAELDVAQVFTSLALLTLVTTPTTKLLTIMPLWAQALGCFERLQSYLELPMFSDCRSPGPFGQDCCYEISGEHADQQRGFEMIRVRPKIEGQATSAAMISCVDAKISLSNLGTAVLTGITFDAQKGSLTVIVGPTGCGKTTLLKSLLGETGCTHGSISVFTSSIAYCSQTPWLTNTNVRDLIVGPNTRLGAIDEVWYRSVVHACDLSKDIERMPDGDNSQLGSKGISVSGGQKARLALARAVYARKDLLILDDIFSALDTRTEENIIQRLFSPSGLLRKHRSTTLLVTYSRRVLRFSDNVIMLSNDGKIEYQGTPSHLSASKDYIFQDNHPGGDVEEPPAPKKTTVPKGPSKEDEEDLARRTGDWSIYRFYFSTFRSSFLALFVTFSAGMAFTSSFSRKFLYGSTHEHRF